MSNPPKNSLDAVTVNPSEVCDPQGKRREQRALEAEQRLAELENETSEWTSVHRDGYQAGCNSGLWLDWGTTVPLAEAKLWSRKMNKPPEYSAHFIT